jgi:hypothetical protein
MLEHLSGAITMIIGGSTCLAMMSLENKNRRCYMLAWIDVRINSSLLPHVLRMITGHLTWHISLKAPFTLEF